MDQKRLHSLLAKWTKVEDFQKLATVLFVETNGDARKLQSNYEKEKSTYGQIASNIFGENNSLHRFLLYNIWSSNKGSVREHFASIARENGRRKKIRTTPYAGKDKSEHTLCWCTFSSEVSIEKGLDTITCCKCLESFHTLCAGITTEYMNTLHEYICIQCANTPELPKIFKESLRSKGYLGAKKLFPPIPNDDLSDNETRTTPKVSPAKTQSNDDTPPKEKPTTPTLKSPKKESKLSPNKNEKEINLSDEEIFENLGSDTSFIIDSEGDSSPMHSQKCSDDDNSDIDETLSPKQFHLSYPKKLSDIKSKTTTKKVKEKTKQKNWEDLDPNEEVDTSSIPSTWSMHFAKKEWKKILKLNKTTGKFETKEDYGDRLQTNFSQTNPVCVFKMNRKRIVSPGDEGFGNKSYFQAYALCTGEYCKAHYVFSTSELPSADGTDLNVKHTSGLIKHFHGEENKRWLKGAKREKVKKELKHKLASNIYRKGHSSADQSKISKGNIDDVKTLKIFQQAKVEAAKDDDLHENILVDLLLTRQMFNEKYKNAKFNGIVQHISLFPFMVIMYTYESMQLLRKLTSKESINIFMDSTSSIAQALPRDFDARRIFYYALIVRSKKSKPCPILEFYTAQQDAIAILYCLESFFFRYKRIYDIKSFNYKINRLELDYSPASIHAACRVFVGKDVDQYMNSFWNAALGTDSELKFVIHICRIHVIRFLKFKVAELYRGKSFENERKLLLKLFYRFVSSKTVSQMAGTLEDLFVLVCSRKRSVEVEAVVLTLEQNLPGRVNSSWENYTPESNNQNVAFYLRSMFGGFINQLADITISNSEDDDDLDENKFYSTELLEYVRLHIAPFSPLMTKIPFVLAGLVIDQPTNNYIENWMKILKHDILEKKRYQKLTRVIRIQAVQSLGCVREALGSYPMTQNDNITQPSKSDLEFSNTTNPRQTSGSKGRLGKKGTLFSPSKSQDGFKTEHSFRSEPESSDIKDMELIPWGGRYKKTTFSNTCSFDCVLQFLYYLYFYTKQGKTFIDEMLSSKHDSSVALNLPIIFACISEKKFAKAKKIWVKEILGKELPSGDLNLEEEEMEYGISPLKDWFPIAVTTLCPNPLCKRNKEQTKIKGSTCILKKTQEEFLKTLSQGLTDECSKCNCKNSHVFFGPADSHNYGIFAYSQVGISRTYKKNPDFDPLNDKSAEYMVETQRPNCLDIELQDQVEIFGERFKLVGYSLFNGRHYILVILVGKKRYVYDGLAANEELKRWDPSHEDNVEYGVSTVWLMKINH